VRGVCVYRFVHMTRDAMPVCMCCVRGVCVVCVCVLCVCLCVFVLYCRALQRDAASCGVLQYVAALLQRVAHIPMADGSGVAGLAHSLPCVVYYSVLQCVAVCCSMLQSIAVCCNALQCDGIDSSERQRRGIGFCPIICRRCVAVCCSVLQYVAARCRGCCSAIQCAAVRCSAMA